METLEDASVARVSAQTSTIRDWFSLGIGLEDLWYPRERGMSRTAWCLSSSRFSEHRFYSLRACGQVPVLLLTGWVLNLCDSISKMGIILETCLSGVFWVNLCKLLGAVHGTYYVFLPDSHWYYFMFLQPSLGYCFLGCVRWGALGDPETRATLHLFMMEKVWRRERKRTICLLP